MTQTEPKKSRLVVRLEALAAEQDRAALASLRASLNEHAVFDGLRLVLPYIGVAADASRWSRQRAEDDGLLLAGLFALHPESGELSLAGAMRALQAKTKSESVEARFQALLGASREDLPNHLRHAISLVASMGLAIDWTDLHDAIRFWGTERDTVRRQWARDYWVDTAEPSDTDTTSTPPSA